MKLTRAAVASGILVATVALAACSSSGSGGSSNTGSNGGGGGTPTTGNSSSSSSSSDITCFSGKLNAEGSSAQANAMTAWIKAYQTACPGATINYNPLGSGDGVTAFIAKQVQFAGSDAALVATPGATAQANKACGSTALDLPMVGGPIAIGYNLKGVSSLTMDGTTLAEIFEGKITNWDDAAIKKLNPNATLPNLKITPFYRSDASGTTYNVERYLAATAPKVFTSAPNTDSTDAKFAGQGKTGSQGVAQATSSTQGGIGYFEYSYAVQSGLPTVNIDNGSGAVQISPDASSTAISSAKLIGKGSDLTLDLNYATTAKGAYPITLVTYEVVCSKYASSSDAAMVKDFLDYTVTGGQTALKSEGYAPLPTSLQSKVEASVTSIS